MPDLARDELEDGCAIATFRDEMDPRVLRTVLVMHQGPDGSHQRGIAVNVSERAAAVAHEEAVKACRAADGIHPHQVLYGAPAPHWPGAA